MALPIFRGIRGRVPGLVAVIVSIHRAVPATDPAGET
jgi:hypothetical protein